MLDSWLRCSKFSRQSYWKPRLEPWSEPWSWKQWIVGGILGLSCPFGIGFEAAWAESNVLILHSYNANLSWTATLKQGIEETFEQSGHDVQLFHEFLDAKRFPNLEHQITFLENLKVKYQKTSIDVVMVSDDPGLAMFLKYRDVYFPTQPAVFLGINQIQPELFDIPGLTGVFETHSQEETVIEALRLHGNDGLIALTDSSESGQALSQKLKRVKDLPKPPKQLVILEDLTPETLPLELHKYPKNWPLLPIGQLRQDSPNGPLISFKEHTRLVRDVVPNPIYGSSPMHIGHGAVGGKILDSQNHAEEAVGLAIAILNGTAPEDLPPITKSKNIWLFDNNELQRFSIDPKDLPAGSRIINAQESFYQQHWRLVWLTGIGFAVTLLIIVLLAEVIRRGASAARILQENQIRYKDLAEAGANVFWELDHQMRFTYISGDTEGLHGLKPKDFLGRTPHSLFAHHREVELDWGNFSDHFQARAVFEDFRFRLREGEKGLRIFKLNGKPIIENGEFLGYRGIKREITEEYQLAEDLAYQATYDALTGLVNRQTFDQTLQQTVQRVQRTGLQAVLCYLDLDHFKIVNDTAGHLVGDHLLTEIAQVLRQSVRANDTVGRLGGDEFALILENCSLARAQTLCEALTQTIKNYRFQWAKRQFQVGVSIGLVPIEAKSANAVELLSHADLACYRAKELGRNRAYGAKPGDTTLAMQQRQMGHLATLSQALEEHRFFLLQQPIVALSRASDSPHFEVLLRLRDEQGQTISPDLFIPEAERCGLITQIDRWVLETTIKMLPQLKLPDNGLVSINLSGASLSNESFLQETIALIKAAAEGSLSTPAISPRCICFEITETAAIAHLEPVKTFMRDLKALGVQFALDDFGSGVSSFGYLRELPVDFLKIDGSLIKNIHRSSTDRAIVALITNLAQMMSIQTIAEFVENEKIRQILQELGVDYGQGCGLGKPQALETTMFKPQGTKIRPCDRDIVETSAMGVFAAS